MNSMQRYDGKPVLKTAPVWMKALYNPVGLYVSQVALMVARIAIMIGAGVALAFWLMMRGGDDITAGYELLVIAVALALAVPECNKLIRYIKYVRGVR